MTLAPAIEIGNGASPTPGPGKALGTARETGSASQAAATSAAGSPQGFRAGWQSLLASMGAGGEDLIPAGSNQTGSNLIGSEVLSGSMPALSSRAEAVSESTAAAANPASGAGLGLQRKTGQESAVPSSSAEGSQALAAQPGAAAAAQTALNQAAAPGPVVSRSVASRTGRADRTAEPESKSSRRARSTETTQATQSRTVAGEALPGVVPAAILGLQTPPVTVSLPVQASDVNRAANGATSKAVGSAWTLTDGVSGIPSIIGAQPASPTDLFRPAKFSPANSSPASLSPASVPTLNGTGTATDGLSFSHASEARADRRVASPGSGQALSEPLPEQAQLERPAVSQRAMAATDTGRGETALSATLQSSVETVAPGQAAEQLPRLVSTPASRPDAETHARIDSGAAAGAYRSQSLVPVQSAVLASASSRQSGADQASGANAAQRPAPAPAAVLASSPALAQSADSDGAHGIVSDQGQIAKQAPAVASFPVSNSTSRQTLTLGGDINALQLPTAEPASVPGASRDAIQAPVPTRTAAQATMSGASAGVIPLASQSAVQMQASGWNVAQAIAPSPVPTESSTLGAGPNAGPILSSSSRLDPQQTLVSGPPQMGVAAANQGVAGAAIPADSLNQSLAAVSVLPMQAGQAQSASAAGNKPVSSLSGKGATPGSWRSAGGAGRPDPASQLKHLTDSQGAGPVVDASAMMRDPAGAHGSGSAAGDSAGGRAASSGGPTPSEAVGARDADSGAGQPPGVEAGPQRAEAGFQDPSLGWVSVRADRNDGGVHAELVAGSADAAQALSGHMEGLNTYLTDHHTPVETLTLSSPASSWTASGGNQGSDFGSGQGTQQDTSHQGAGQHTPQEAATSVAAGFLSASSVLQTTAASGLAAWPGGADASTLLAAPGGVHISVMA